MVEREKKTWKSGRDFGDCAKKFELGVEKRRALLKEEGGREFVEPREKSDTQVWDVLRRFSRLGLKVELLNVTVF